MPYKNKEKQLECQRRWYSRNKDKQIKWVRLQDKKKQEWFEEYKRKLKCSNCAESDYACLDFHHINPDEKEENIYTAVYIRRWGIKRIQLELEKCTVLCANCHRKLHRDMRENDKHARY